MSYFFAGDPDGATEGLALDEACGEPDASDEGLTLVAGLAAGLAATLAAGAGVGIVAPERSLTTDDGPLKPGSENSSASTMKIVAETIVAFSSGFCAPRGPNAVWLPAPPKAAATSPPLPDWSRITSTRNKQSRMKIAFRT